MYAHFEFVHKTQRGVICVVDAAHLKHRFGANPFAVAFALATFHVDHRLLSKEAQEISIISSCSAIGTKIFVPPFNKYNPETIEVIKESKLQLVVWESGWKHLGYQKLDQAAGNYYFHMHDFNDKQLLSLLI